MADIIQLLPDAIANQIAAGEVIQRPASVLKELVENAIDAGASSVKIIIKDAGKTLIQVIDNGCGMSETDARMCFERHATSKIRQAKDLFAIRTMGFRGEAMASIAAVAQVEMKSRRQSDELATRLLIEGSELKKQELCQAPAGTQISIKNLFFNVPARRNFLKSNAVEMRHMLDEFHRIAMANCDVFFSLHHNGAELFHLPKGSLRQRIVGILGKNSNTKLVPVNEETDVMKIKGFVGKPEFAKKTRGEQFFFVNNRFIKSGYLNHAVTTAYEEILQKDTYPLYVIFIDIDPSRIDINVHPTKQEIKFDDERLVYNYLKVTVRHALAQHHVTPSLNFEIDDAYLNRYPNKKESPGKPQSMRETLSSKMNDSAAPSESKRQASNLKNWQKMYDGLDDIGLGEEAPKEGEPLIIKSKMSEGKSEEGLVIGDRKQPYQIHTTYIVSQIKSGYMLIDQQSAHERILYEKYLSSLDKKEPLSQRELFPKTIQLNSGDAALLKPLLPQVNQMGLDIQDFGQDSFVVHGLPADQKNGSAEELVEGLLEQFKQDLHLDMNINERLAYSLSKTASIKRGQKMGVEEMRALIDQLFACAMPYKSPSGKKCFITYDLGDLQKKFEN